MSDEGEGRPWKESIRTLEASLKRPWVAPLDIPLRLTARWRVLPDFLIVGAQRAGSTSLYRYLVEHPLVLEAFTKEVHYLDRHATRPISWYRAHFPLAVRMRALERLRGHRPVTGEATPYYLFHPFAHERAAEVVPEARIVAILRDPVERAFSHWRHMRGLGHETLDFEAAIQAEPDRLKGEVDRMREDPSYASLVHPRFSYVARGLYAEQLERWFDAFGRERVLVLQSEAFFEDPGATLDELTAHLGIGPFELDRYETYNPSGSSPEMDPDVRARLAERYEEPNERLFELLGERFEGWTFP